MLRTSDSILKKYTTLPFKKTFLPFILPLIVELIFMIFPHIWQRIRFHLRITFVATHVYDFATLCKDSPKRRDRGLLYKIKSSSIHYKCICLYRLKCSKRCIWLCFPVEQLRTKVASKFFCGPSNKAIINPMFFLWTFQKTHY